MSEGPDSPDLTDVDEVWLGNSTSMAGGEFVAALNAVSHLQSHMRQLQDEFADLDIGLDREDAVCLLWGRTNMTKTQVRSSFEVMDAIVEEEPGDIAPRLMADQTSDLTIAEAAEVWGDLVDLAEKYGSLNDTDDEAKSNQ